MNNNPTARFVLVAVGILAAASSVALGGIDAGLVVQLGADDVATAVALSRTGCHLIQVLDTRADRVVAAQAKLREQGRYGLVSARLVDSFEPLPYAENLVNHVIVTRAGAAAKELFRAMAPGGTLTVSHGGTLTRAQAGAAGFEGIAASGAGLTARKPWPSAMDGWSHPRHGADGNAVSDDTAVGPPDRIRWVAGATHEVEGIVSAGGRNFYGGILARDSFNGLRLWNRDLGKAQQSPVSFMLPRLAGNRARPVASGTYVVAIQQGRLVSLDARTGQTVHTFAGLNQPRELLLLGNTVVSCDDTGAAAFELQSAKPLWRHEAAGIRNLAADDGKVVLIHGGPPGKSRPRAAALDVASGSVLWVLDDRPWLAKVVRTVLHGKYLAFEVSSLTDHDAGNALHVFDARTGEALWDKAYPPGMNHNRQARAMFVGKDLWILYGGKTNTADRAHVKRLPIQARALDPDTGETRVAHPAGLAHCFPPVATASYMLSGVMDFTDLKTGAFVANPITKANCSRENGWVPANGLIYTTPKHCTCWPILRGYVALAPRGAAGASPRQAVDKIPFALEKGPGWPVPDAAPAPAGDWPLYRHDSWRSASTTAPGPQSLDVLWTCKPAPNAALPAGPIVSDWRENAFVKGPVSAPTIAGGLAFVARGDAHEVVAVNTADGSVRWRFTADGRVDTPPTIHRGVCLFGTHAGWVYALRADSGAVAWRFRAAPNEEQIVAYGQVESPWPVAGTVLVIDDVAYFAAGRQPFADGGIFLFAIDPLTGRRRWVHRLDTIPQKGFYENSALEFDPIDILHQEGDGIAMSRWILSRDGKKVSVDKWNAFARLDTGGGAVWVPRGCWTYGPRHQARFRGEAARRPLCAFRDRVVLSSFNASTGLFRRDFDIEHGEKFNSKWMTGWEAGKIASKGGNPYRTYRLAEKAAWKVDPFASKAAAGKAPLSPARGQNEVYGMAMAGDGRLFVVHKDGRLKVIAVADGAVLSECQVPPPLWDGLAIANRRLYLSTQAGELVCIGK